MPEYGLQWGVYWRGAWGFRVERYHGTKSIVAIAVTWTLAKEFAAAMNRGFMALGAKGEADGR